MKRVTELDWKLVQQINIWFCVKMGMCCVDTISTLTTIFGQNCLSARRIRHWYREFEKGRDTLVDLQRRARDKSGRSPANIQTIQTLLQTDRRMTVHAMERQTGIPHTTIHRILRKDLHLQKKCAKFVPKILNPDQLRERFECSQTMLRAVHRNPEILKRIVTSDESWMYQYDPDLKCHSSEWLGKHDPRPMKAMRSRATGKVLLISFFDFKGMIHMEFLRNRTVNTELFIQILGRLKDALHNRRPNQRYSLHMDNASCHTSRDTRLHLLFTGMKAVIHPPYSPDLAPSDFWLFHRIKLGLRGQTFPDLDTLEDAVRQEVAQIPSYEYEDCILKKWPMRWARCVNQNGDYFEGLQ